MNSIQQEEAISLSEYHDPVTNTLWYIIHTDDRTSTTLDDGTRLDLSPDPSGRWRLIWVRDDVEFYSLWVSASDFEEAVEIWKHATRITNDHPEMLSGPTPTSFCRCCPVRAECPLTWELGDTKTVDLNLTRRWEAALNEIHQGLHV